eukprot:15347955-Ditylum_brightwellii.AAC.1
MTEHEQSNLIDDEKSKLKAVNEPRAVDKHLIEQELSGKLRDSTSKARHGDEAARACSRQEDHKWRKMHAEAREEDCKWCKMHETAGEDQRKHEEHVLARVYER